MGENIKILEDLTIWLEQRCSNRNYLERGGDRIGDRELGDDFEHGSRAREIGLGLEGLPMGAEGNFSWRDWTFESQESGRRRRAQRMAEERRRRRGRRRSGGDELPSDLGYTLLACYCLQQDCLSSVGGWTTVETGPSSEPRRLEAF